MTRRPDVLLYGMNFAPELTGIGRYSGELAIGLAQRGAKVEAVTTPPHYPGWFVRPPYAAGRYQSENFEGVDVVRCPLMLRNAGGGLRRLLPPLSFALTSAPVVAWRILTRRPRAVICIEPTLFAAPIAILAAKLVGARLALHIQDLEVDAAFAVGHLARHRWLLGLGLAFERWVMRRFDTVVTISQEMAKRIVAKGVAQERVEIIRNWVDTSRLFPLGRPSRYRGDLDLGADTFVVLYSGQIGAKQTLHVVFEAAERLAGRSDIHFVIAGEGPLKAEFASRYGGLPNITLLGLQPEKDLNEFLNLADCHILPQHPAVKDLVLPSKLGGMLASGGEILVTADDDSELAAFLGDSCFRLRPEQVDGELTDTIAALPAQLADGGSLAAGREKRREARLTVARSLNFGQALERFGVVLGSASRADRRAARNGAPSAHSGHILPP